MTLSEIRSPGPGSAGVFVLFGLFLALASGCSRMQAAPSVWKIDLGCDGDELAFSVKELEAPAGVPIEITFANDAPTSQVYHNFVLVEKGSEARVATLGVQVGFDLSWVPRVEEVLAASALLKPGEQDTVLIGELAPGEYSYICTVPGHCPAMSGVLRVK